jgi:hypothetical protein
MFHALMRSTSSDALRSVKVTRTWGGTSYGFTNQQIFHRDFMGSSLGFHGVEFDLMGFHGIYRHDF